MQVAGLRKLIDTEQKLQSPLKGVQKIQSQFSDNSCQESAGL